MTASREASLDALNRAHVFPGPFMFKVIGENSPEFVARVVQAAVGVLGPQEKPEVTVRESSGRRHQAVTMVVVAPSAERVLDIYAILGKLDGVEMVL